MGGYVALALARKTPTNIKGLFLLNSTSSADNEQRKEIRKRATKMAQKHFDTMVRMSFTNLFFETNSTHYKNEIQLALREALKTSLQGYIACQEGMLQREDTATTLKQLSCKKMLVIGENDPILKKSELLTEAKKKPTLRMLLLEGGHMSHIESKEALIKTLKAFIKSC